MRLVRVVVALGFALAGAAPLLAQGALNADEKEIAAYTLTMPTLNKVVSAMRSMAKEMMQDPKYQQVMKVEKQIADAQAEITKLEAKTEMTEADGAKVEALNAQLEKLREQKEQLEQSLEAGNPMDGNAKTLTEMEQNIKRVPMFTRALEREGLSPREFSKFMLAMLQAGMVHGFSQGKVDYSKLPPGINPENVKFIDEHQAELEALRKEFESIGKGH